MHFLASFQTNLRLDSIAREDRGDVPMSPLGAIESLPRVLVYQFAFKTTGEASDWVFGNSGQRRSEGRHSDAIPHDCTLPPHVQARMRDTAFVTHDQQLLCK